MKSATLEERDMVLENMTTFMQHGLTTRNFARSMREGDSGRLLASLSYYTVWFQASSQHKYAAETLHLSACIKKFWSEDYKRFWMENALINPSGKKNGFMADDYFGEWVIREMKMRIPSHITDATLEYLQHTVSPQLMFLRQVRKHMTAETEAPTYGYHSSTVKKMIDIDVVVAILINESACGHEPGRGMEDSEAADLFAKGLEILGNGERIGKYKKRLGNDEDLARIILSDEDWDDDGDESFPLEDDEFELSGDEDGFQED
jgi:hypothetical protein